MVLQNGLLYYMEIEQATNFKQYEHEYSASFPPAPKGGGLEVEGKYILGPSKSN